MTSILRQFTSIANVNNHNGELVFAELTQVIKDVTCVSVHKTTRALAVNDNKAQFSLYAQESIKAYRKKISLDE